MQKFPIQTTVLCTMNLVLEYLKVFTVCPALSILTYRGLLEQDIDRMWSFYLRKAQRVDKEMTDAWKGDTDGILIFVC